MLLDFCEKYAEFRSCAEPVMRQTHKFGEKCFVDYAGETLTVIDPETGEVRRAQLLVGVLGGSNYTYPEATWPQELPNWLLSHVRMFEYFGGCPEIVVPDNLKSGVRKPDYYEPDVNPAYNDLATHYGVAVLPARVYRPRDKAKAENGVLIAERWIIASLRIRTLYSLDELNEAVSEKLHVLNRKPFQKLEGCRQSMFEQQEKPPLRPLPAERYQYTQWKRAKVSIDCHIEVEAHYYSVPHQLIRETVEVRLTSCVVEVLHGGKRVASHRRSYVKGGHTTLAEHMPPKHAKMLEWTPSAWRRGRKRRAPRCARRSRKSWRAERIPSRAFALVSASSGCLKRMGPSGWRLHAGAPSPRVRSATRASSRSWILGWTRWRFRAGRALSEPRFTTRTSAAPTTTHRLRRRRCAAGAADSGQALPDEAAWDGARLPGADRARRQRRHDA